MKRFAAWFSRWQPVSAAVVVALIAQAADVVSSLLCNRVVGIYETNPYVRDTAGHFILYHGIAVKAIYALALACILYGLYHIGCLISEGVGRLAVAGLLMWNATETMFIAAHNFLLALNWKTPLPFDFELMMRLFR